MIIFSADYLEELTGLAKSSSRLRQHKNIHRDFSDPSQRLLNAIEPNSYIRPHRHAVVPRDELLMAIRGLMAFITFDDQGRIKDIVRFGSEKHGSAIAVGVEVPSDIWHTVLALEQDSILLEVKAGPFDPSQPKELAPWAPEEHSVQSMQYLLQLRDAVVVRDAF